MDPVSFPDPHRHAGHLVHGRGEQVRQGGADGHHRTAQRLPHQERMVTGFVRFKLTRRELQRWQSGSLVCLWLEFLGSNPSLISFLSRSRSRGSSVGRSLKEMQL